MTPPLHEALATFAHEGWANESVVTPAGLLARISIEPAELQEITEAFEAELAEVGLTEHAELIGHWLLHQVGELRIVGRFGTEGQVTRVYQRVRGNHERR